MKKDTEEARGFKFRGTPTFVVGGVSIRGAAPVEVFEDAVNQAQGSGKAATGKGAKPEAKKECATAGRSIGRLRLPAGPLRASRSGRRTRHAKSQRIIEGTSCTASRGASGHRRTGGWPRPAPAVAGILGLPEKAPHGPAVAGTSWGRPAQRGIQRNWWPGP